MFSPVFPHPAPLTPQFQMLQVFFFFFKLLSSSDGLNGYDVFSLISVDSFKYQKEPSLMDVGGGHHRIGLDSLLLWCLR